MNFNSKKGSGCKCLYTNADQYLNKRTELEAWIEIQDPDIIGITEIKYKNNRHLIQESEINIQGYELFHNLSENGRGIALWIKPTLKPAAIEVNTIFQENIFVECKLEDGETLKIGLIYRSPSSTNENSSKLNSIISEMCKNKNDNIIIMGDFNYKDIDWETESCSVSSDQPASKFLQSCKDNFLVQMQRSSTRFKNNQTPSLLDLVLTNKEELITNIDTEAGLGKSDHVTLVISLSCKAKNTKYEPRLNYRKADLKALNEDLAKVDWEVELKDLNTESMWSKIKDNIETAIEKHVPKTKPHGSKLKKWMSKETFDIVKNKHRHHRIDKQSTEESQQQST